MGEYAKKTNVPVTTSRNDIETTLRRYGCTAFHFGWDTDRGLEMVQFRLKDREIRLQVRQPNPNEPKVCVEIQKKQTRTTQDILDAHLRQRWRALNLYVLAVCEAIDSDVVTIDEAFMSAIVMPDDRTMGEHATEAIAKYLMEGRLPPLLPGS